MVLLWRLWILADTDCAASSSAPFSATGVADEHEQQTSGGGERKEAGPPTLPAFVGAQLYPGGEKAFETQTKSKAAKSTTKSD